jgi:NAD(P)-dependent dehydrogenase (short-subunit alcohol dehydrogenase family)
MQELNGKVAFVTGGASGIGLAIATSLSKRGVAVALADIDEAAARAAAEKLASAGGRAFGVHCDVTREDSLETAADATAAELGDVHIVVNNAGAFTVGALEDTKRSDWEWLLELNVVGVTNGLRLFLPRLKALDEETHIVNTASVSGHVPVAGLSIYTASKFAVVGLTECLRLELAGTKIGLSVLCPGIVRTSLLETSPRHRPERHGRGETGSSPIQAVIESGTDPADVGEQVSRAIESGEFYVFTHPPLRPAFEKRCAEILQSYPD